MTKQVQHRRGSTAQHATFTGAQGEVTVDTDKKSAVVHDGLTPGGFPLARSSELTAVDARVTQAYADFASSAIGKGASLVAYDSTRTVKDVLDCINVIDVKGLAGWADITSRLQFAALLGGAWLIPAGNYEWTSVSFTRNVNFYGTGDSTVLRRTANVDTNSPSTSLAIGLRLVTHGITVTLRDLCLDGNQANQIVEAYGYLAGYSDVTGTAGQDMHLACYNVTFRNQTQASIRADGDTLSSGRELLTVQGCRFYDGRPGGAAGDGRFANTSGYGPDYITLTDKVYAEISGNWFIYRAALTSIDFAPTAIRITFNTNTTNADGARATITGNYFYGCGRGERYTLLAPTGGTGSGFRCVPATLSGSAISTFVITDGGSGYTAADVLTDAGGATFTVSTVNAGGAVLTATLGVGGTGYSLPIRAVNDVGVIDAYARGRLLNISDNRFENCQGSPIRGKTNCDLLIIHGNLIDDCGLNPGINIGPNSYAEQNGHISISHNIIDGCGGYGIGVVGNAGATTSGPPNTQGYVAEVAITNNIVRTVAGWNMQSNPVLGEGIYMRNFRGVNVHGNIVYDTALRGIYLRGQSGTYDSKNCSVIGNRTELTGGTGIYVETGNAGLWSVIGNTVVSAVDRGFDVQCTTGSLAVLTYTGNTVDGAYDYGHYQRRWERATIVGNHAQNIGGVSRGFYPQDSTYTKVTMNTVGAGVTTPLFGGGVAQTAIQDFQNSWNPKHVYGTAAPTTGTWVAGDKVIHSAPAAGGFEGWVCTTGGTPGTWKTFGAISA